MKITRDQLMDLLDDLCSEVSRVVATHAEICRELAEDSLDQRRTDAQQQRIDRVKAELEDEKTKLSRLRQSQRHKREVERSRKEHGAQRQHESQGGGGAVALRNGQGRLIGWLQPVGANRLNVLDAKGRLVAREIDGMTLDRRGRLVGHGKQGLVVLGYELARN